MNDRFTGWRKASYSGGSGACVEVAAGWRKSSYSDANGNCVEISGAERVIGVRDTKQRGAGLVLEIPGSAWRAFLSEVKGGRLDC
jgi:hypothetical protein